MRGGLVSAFVVQNQLVQGKTAGNERIMGCGHRLRGKGVVNGPGASSWRTGIN